MEFKPNIRDLSLMWDNAPSHVPTTPNRVSPFQDYVKDQLGMKGIIQTPPYSAWFNPVELFFSYVKRYVRKFAPPDIPSLLQRIREATTMVTGEMIQGWFKKSGFIVGPDKPHAVDPNAGVVDRCSLPKHARFDRKEHVVCADVDGVVQREKKMGHTKWSTYNEDVGELQNVSVVKRSGLPPKKKHIVRDCPLPDEETTRWVGLSEEPADLKHASYEHFFQNPDDMAEVDSIVGERKTGNMMEYLVHWKDSSDSENEWIASDKIMGLSSLLMYWRERNKRRTTEKKVSQNKQAANSVPYKPTRNAVVGDVVAIYAPKDESNLFFIGKVLSVSATKFDVHWWDSKTIDGIWSEQFLAKKGKGTAGPYVGQIHKEAVIDKVPNFFGQKKGKIAPSHLAEIVKLVNAKKS